MGRTLQQPKKAIDKKDVQKKGTFPQRIGPVDINYPVLWLAVIAFIVYCPTFSFGFTELDDSIFIRDFQSYNENLGNLITSFHRGLFDAVKDPYYRPLFLDSMVINYLFSGQNIMGYHIVNVLLHMASVVLLYQVLVRCKINEFQSFLLAIIFTVHPVLSQAVAWIPGRNDTLLAVFAFSFLVCAIDYQNKSKPGQLALSALFLLLAFFTKETAVFIPPVAFIIFIMVLGKNWLARTNIIQYVTWAACFAVWFAMRSQASNIKAATQPDLGIMAGGFVRRLPLIVQYLGKIFIPFNLSVFPMQQDTTYLYGLVAIPVLAVALFFSKNVDWRRVIAGFSIFLLLLIPALLVPNSLNEQTFEHRLYLPVLGILLVISESVAFKKLSDENLLTFTGITCALLAIGNFSHQRNFTDPHTFWTNAVATSPHSAYANMMLGAREDNLERSYSLFHRAYQLNPKEKYINYYYGKMLQMQDSVLASEPYLLAEKANSGYYECDFYLARSAMMRHDTTASMNYLKTYLKADPANGPANNNLVLIYMSRGMVQEARQHIASMQRSGVQVPPELLRMVN